MAGKTILIIDTDTDTIQKIMSTLESEGYLVFSASSKDVSLTMANKVNPSLIFINIGLGGTSGLEICKAIHETEVLKSVPIVIITPHRGPIDPRHTSLYGIVDSLKKPFSPVDLISKTEEVLAAEPGVEWPVEEARAQPAGEEFDAIFAKEGIRTEPIEEEIEAMPVEEEAQSAEEEWMAEETLKRESGAEPMKQETKVKPPENELETLLMEEEVESRKSREPETVAEKESVRKAVPGKTVPEKGEMEQMAPAMKEEKTEQILQEEPEEAFPESPAFSEERGRSYVAKRRMRGKGRKSSLLVPLIVLLIVIAAAAGYMLYGNFWQKTEVQKPVAVKPLKPVQAPIPVVEQPQEMQKTQQAVEETKPAAAPAVTPVPAPAPVVTTSPMPSPAAPVQQAKPSVKAVYSVQVGVFKNEAGASALSKKYKEKGYEAFMHRSIIKNKGTVYRVLLGSFENRKEAAKFAQDVRDKEKITAVIFHE